ncbi:zf-C2HC5-domain-containing protein [Annulohypoxylon maeteangense]|uniref:zf-C2HC5-domain-containing protein n=1 Tax=Annulohypoxylon maeteangense TaxID=1927788 RepID=UPI002007E46C|nr:zf-C2HC5-domain-containing protein [Annulohypoxylon maeteangense]KAI0889491.1 zf-C2HC5-domain-containing protein [Annulohypoxylon maeteangense]
MSVSQLHRLLPLPDDELKQVLDYATKLSKSEAAEHFRNLLGESPEAIDFIATFNSKRQDPRSSAPASNVPSSGIEPVPRPVRATKKQKAQLHTPVARQVTNQGPAPGAAYSKNVESDYIPRRPSLAMTSLRPSPPNKYTSQSSQQPTASLPPKLPPFVAGHLISDIPKPKLRSTPTSRSTTPASKTKIHISGGIAMHGASTALADLDDAIRVLEMTTNPGQGIDDADRRCNCVASRHPLLAAAPNCLSCGKVICVKEGLGPCTFCGTPLLTSTEVQLMIRELREERGRERMAADREAHKKAEVSKKPAPFSKPREISSEISEAQAKALENRDRLLGFQAQNARRTTVRDEAADFDISGAMAGAGSNIWATPEERARELKRQQKVLREMEWDARPGYEKRRQVVSIDLVGGKVVRKMAAIERPESPEDKTEVSNVSEETSAGRGGGTGGAFSRNPLLGPLIRPVFDAKGKGALLEGRDLRVIRWRRVQDDLDNNEAVILDGGAYGGHSSQQTIANASEEPTCG